MSAGELGVALDVLAQRRALAAAVALDELLGQPLEQRRRGPNRTRAWRLLHP